MATIHCVERSIVHRLHAVFHRQTGALSKFLQQIQDIIGNAVGPSADGKPDDERMFEGARVESTEFFDGRVGVRGGLEISLKLIAVVASFESPDALFNLLENVLAREPATRTEAAVVTEGATASRHRAIHVRAGEPTIHAHLLHTHAEECAEVMVVSVIAQARLAPGRNR